MKKRSDEGTSSNHFDQNNDVPDNVLQFDDSDITDIFEKIGNNDSDSIKAINKLFEYKVFVHVFDECAQDSEITLAILKDVLGRVKNSNPEITKAFIRADNAGCYHSADTLVSVTHMSKLTGIAIKRFDFCDPQGGKGACDRYAAVIKSHVRRYLNENHNVTNATEFVEACHSYKGVKGVLALNCKIVKDNSKKNKKCTIKQITNYYNFEYRADGLLVHRSWNVGPGLLIYWSRLNLDYRILDIVSNQIEGFLHNWVHTEEKNESDMMDIDDCTTDESEISPRGGEGKALFECDVREGCTAAFMKFGNLMNHILRGRHNPKPERFSLKDTAMKLYHCKLEEVGNRRMISIDIQEKQINHAETRPLSKGWALPIRKPHKEFSAKQREYLKAKFNEGVSGVKHWKPRDVVADMENLRVNNMFYFSASEILTENQIRSFFGRMNRERQTVGSTENIGRRMDIGDNSAQNVNEKNDEEETDLDLQILEEFQDMEAAVEETLAVENAFSIAQETLEACVT
ncbi:unnamed protein product [Rotaria sp. Silwood1]|nr:unnamed protein product [Rotaria sp. Silwood1]CAF4992672.1 unnamed protein product [Rotaria sp. Silwood1]